MSDNEKFNLLLPISAQNLLHSRRGLKDLLFIIRPYLISGDIMWYVATATNLGIQWRNIIRNMDFSQISSSPRVINKFLSLGLRPFTKTPTATVPAIPGLTIDQCNQLLSLLQQHHVSDQSSTSVSHLVASTNFAGPFHEEASGVS
nr:uncharacterized protein LOC108944369 [Nicotiana tomentosiformis]